jgi:8-oxo-dGTP diphosphatase
LCDYFLCEYLTGTAENRDVVENVSVIWVERDSLMRFIPKDRIFPPILEALEAHRMTESAEATERPSIVAAVIVQDHKVLLVQRRVREGTLWWQFPAGEMETGETAYATAVRETKEEVDLTVRGTRSLGERDHPATGRHMAYVACDLVQGTPRVADTDELAALTWCALQELPDYVPHGFFEPVQEYLNLTLSH